ncbi:MAG: FHA domain-containing protein [Candidatus Eisenbacteria bacterium]|uniref:FHA domain-containing protein n=1 Tax=Eiseniibacteriota bacterium TaxID=2212470 RepID=A0A7Y2H340_UNCEI|nr:FHA domain-containing protein [Candidatus Eisenbacteria bacterium]
MSNSVLERPRANTPPRVPPAAPLDSLIDAPSLPAKKNRSRLRGKRQWLLQREGTFWERGRVLEFTANANEGTLGRSFSCKFRVNDPSVSRIHAALIRKPNRGVYVVDLASRKGTYVNGQKVKTEMLLMDGDLIRLGDRVILEFMDSPPPVESPERLWYKRFFWAGAVLVALGLLFVLSF